MIEKFGVKVFGMREIELFGIKEVMRMAKLAIDPYDNRSLHVSFDIDSLDPCLEAPSTGTPGIYYLYAFMLRLIKYILLLF